MNALTPIKADWQEAQAERRQEQGVTPSGSGCQPTASAVPASQSGIPDADLGWALVKPTLTAEEYIPVKVMRRGKRFTFVQTLSGHEWRYTTRGLWEVPTYEAAQAEIEAMRQYRISRSRGAV